MKIKYIISALLIAGCFAVGIFFKYYSNIIDSPIEQIAETVLKQQGIDVDFSEDKKNINEPEDDEDDNEDDEDDGDEDDENNKNEYMLTDYTE